MEKFDGTLFWNQLDSLLKERTLTVYDLARALGINQSTLYMQKKRHQLPKSAQLNAMEKFLGISLLEERNNRFEEYLYYLEKAEEWQLKAVREILKMPELKKDSGSISQVG